MGRYTAVDVERNYQEYKKKKNEKKIPDRDYGKTVADYAIEIAMNGGMSKDLNKRYTAVDVEKNYQEYEKKKNEKIIPDRDYGKTAADYAIEMFRNKNAMYNSTGTKEESQQRFLDDHMLKGGLLNPYSAASRAHEDMRSTPEFPTWQPMVERMSDGQVEYARNLLKNQLMDTDRSDFEAYTQSAKETGDKLALYQNELKKREYAKAAAEAQANIERYQKKQNDALSVLSDEQLAVMDEYIDAKKALSAGLTANSLTTSPYTGGNIGAITTSLGDVNKQFQGARKELESYGIEDLDKLVQYRTEIRDAQRTAQMNDEVQKMVNAPGAKGVAGSALLTAADVLMSPVTGITAAGESLVRKYGYADKESPVNTNSELYALQNFSNATESAINEKIDSPIGKKAYGIGTSMAKSAYSMAIGGQVTKALGLTGKAATTVGNMVTLPQFGASAYASTLQQDQMRGISTEDATKHAVAAGIGEMVFEVVSLDYVWNVARKSGSKAAKQVIIDSLVGAGIEGSEEGFTSIANEVADRIINGDMSEYGQNIQNYIMQGYSVAEAQKMAEKDFYTEVAGDVLAGAISGGIMTGGANAVSYYHYRKMGNHAVADEQLKNEVIDAAKQMQDDTAAKKLVSTKHTEEITGKDMAVILSSMEESAQQEQLVHAEARFRELGENEAQAKADAREVIKAVSQASEDTGIIENAVRTKKFEKNENLQTVYAELLQEDHSKAPAAVVGNVRKSMEAEEFYQAAVSNRQKGVAKAKNSASGRNVVVTKLANIAPKKEAMVELSDGTRMKLSDVEFGDQTTQNLYDFAATMYDSYAANAVVNNYKGEVLHLYENAVAVFYNAGRLGTSSFESMLGNQKNARLVTAVSSPAILHEMYILGQNSEKNAVKEVAVAPVQPKKNAQAKDTKSKNVKPRTTGTVTDNRTDNMDSRMRKIAEQVAKKTGIDITLNDSLAHGEKGNFQKALVRINLSSESNNEYETLVHELNEFAASYNPVGMKKVIDAVLDYAQTQEGAEYLTKRVQQYQNAYARVETDKTYRDASEEFVFDYLAGVFSSEEGIKDFTRYMTEENMSAKEQKGIMETIADFFKKLFDRITSYLNDHVLSDTAKKGLQADAQRAKEIREMVLDAWNEAVYINKQENPESFKNANSEERYSIIVKNFEKEYDAWNKKNFRKTFRVAVTSKVLKNIGVKDADITIDGVKILRILKEHPQMTDDIIKNIPKVISEPVIVMQSKKKESRLVVSGELFDTSNSPVVVILELEPTGKNGIKLDDIKIASAYGKESMQGLMNTSRIMYVNPDMKKTNRWLECTRLQLPFGLTTVGSDGIITSINNVVKNDEKYSIEVDEDGIENYITSEETKALPYKERQKRLLDIMRHEYAGRTAKFEKNGGVYYALYNDVGITKGIYGDKKSDERGRRAKTNIGADGKYIELAENALYYGSKEEVGKNTRSGFHNDAKNWDYYIKTIKSDGRYYNVLINVKDTGENQYVYDITLREQKNKKHSALVNSQMGDLKVGGTASTDSITQNSEKSTKKYSIDVDEALFSAIEETYSSQEQEMASIIEDGFKAIRNVKVDEIGMRKLAYEIKKENQSRYDLETLRENLTRVFAYLKENPNTEFADMVRIVREVARPVIEESTEIDEVQKKMYDDFRNYLKGQKIRLNEEQKAEVAHYYGSYDNFRKLNFGNLTFSDNGTYLNSLWNEICANSYQMLDIEISTADEPIALIDALNALKPTRRNIFGMNKDQASYDLALDIFQKFFRQQAAESANAKVREKTARLNERQREYRKRVKAEYDASLQRLREVEKEKHQKTIDRYEEKIHTLKENQRQAMEYKDVKYANRMKEQIERTKGLLAIAKIEENGKITRLKVQNRENMLNKRRNEEMRKYRERIKKNANGIIAYFNSNTDKKHVPEMLKDTVARFITSIDYMGEHAYTDSAATIRWQEALSQLYMQLSNQNLAIAEGYEEIYNALTGWGEKDETVGGVLEDIQGFLGANANLKISEMGLTQLQELDEMITALKRVITTVNKLYVNKRMEHVSELGESTLAELGEKRDKKAHNELIEKTDTLLNVSMMDARSFFYRLGDTSLSIYEEWRTGFNERVWMLKEAQDYMQGLLKDIDVKSWTGEKAKVHTFMVEGKELQMTTGQIMTLYVLKKRYLAKQHMNNGGIRPEKIGKGKKAIDRVKAIPLTDFDLDKISDELTAEQKQVADAMQQFIENTCAGWGNKASMMLYGYKRFGAKNYFPMKTDGNSVDTKDETDLFAAKKQSFTKETNEHAKNALIIGDIFDVFTNHVSGMATYSAFTAPLMDSMRWFNYRNDQHDSVKTEIERVYGKNYKDYFTQLIRDINGEARNGIDMRIMDDLISKMKAASVGANLRVAIQQPTAYIRAAAVMNPKYLSKAMAAGPKKIKSQMKRAKENSAITLWKSWGYFETSIGRSMKSVITGQDTLRNKVVEKSMIMAQVGDDITWGYLWNACEEEIKDKHPDIAYDSKEFLKLTSERFDEVVDQTQVVDSVLHRSQIMRKTDIGAKMATSFMAEPTKSFNLLMNAVRDIQENGGKSARKRFGRVLAAYVITNTVNAAVVSVADTARNPDEDKDFWERYMEQLKENLVDNLNPLGMIPFAKDILSMTQGFDVARMDMQGLANLLKGWDMVVRYVTDEEYRQTHTAYEALKAITRGVSQVIGVPAYNLLREVETMYNVLTGKYLGGKKYSNTENYGKLMDAKIGGKEEDYDEIEGELRERDKGYFDISSGKRGAAKDELLDAILEGDAERYNEISEELKKNEVNVEGMSDTEENALKQFFLEGKITEEDALEKGISKETIKDWKEEYQEKEEFKRIENEYSFGDITRKQAEKRLQDLGKDENEVWHQMREWDYKIAHPDEEYTGDYKIMHDTIDAAIISERKKGGYDDASRDKIQKEIKALLAHGKEKKDIGASITRRYKEVYLEAKKSGTYATLKNMLISAYMAAGYTRDDAMTKIESWEKE